MNRREMFLRTRGQLLPFILSIIVIVFTETIMVICGIFFNRELPITFYSGIWGLLKFDLLFVVLGVLWNWKYLLDIVFKSTETFSGYLILGERILSSKIADCDGKRWSFWAKNGESSPQKLKIFCDRMSFVYKKDALLADMCNKFIMVRYMKRSKYIVEIWQT